MVFDGVADTIEFEAATLMGDRYMRLQTDARRSRRTTSTTRARRTSRPCAWRPSELIAASGAKLDRACAILAG